MTSELFAKLPPVDASRAAPQGISRTPDRVVEDMALLEEVEETLRNGGKPNLTKEQRAAIGRVVHVASYIYFVLADGPDLIKIGKTRNPAMRIASLRTMSPVPLKPIAIVRAHDRYEQLLHEALKRHRVHGEWYRAAPEVLDLIERATEEGFRALHDFVKKELAFAETLG